MKIGQYGGSYSYRSTKHKGMGYPICLDSDPCSVHNLAYLMELPANPIILKSYIFFRLKQFILIWIIFSIILKRVSVICFCNSPTIPHLIHSIH